MFFFLNLILYFKNYFLSETFFINHKIFQFINSIGYVSLFPMLLELVDPDSPKLGAILDQIRKQ